MYEDNLDLARANNVKEKFKKWLYFSNYDVIDVVMATLIINRKEIDPVWIFLVDPPSSGKTEILRAFRDLKYILPVSSITPKCLISGKVRPDTHKTHKDPSLFAKINNKIFIVKDFTTILSLHPRDQMEIFSLMRDSYDGYAEKKFGETEKIYGYETHYGFLGGVTTIIDQSHSLNQIMGERFLKYRINNDRDKAQVRANENRIRLKEMRVELNAVGDSFLASFQILPEVIWPVEYEKIIDTVSNLVTLVRTPVSRDWREFDVIEVTPEAEMPMRFCNSLKNLGDGLAIVRGKKEITEAEIRTLIKVAFDCLPVKLFQIIKALYGLKDYMIHSAISEKVGLTTITVTRVLEDFFALKVVDMDKSDKYTGYKSKLSESIEEQFSQLLPYMSEVVKYNGVCEGE